MNENIERNDDDKKEIEMPDLPKKPAMPSPQAEGKKQTSGPREEKVATAPDTETEEEIQKRSENIAEDCTWNS
jgi:hypothetical protein